MQQLGVSVIVPVYNPGPFLRPLLDCLDAQEDVEDGYEAIFVDDGSTDASPALLDRWCATRAWARVSHQPHSGWPSRPRNVGIDAAHGEFVFFVDQDDRLADDALARMVRFAREHGSDVILGRMVGAGRGVPKNLFQRTMPDAWPPAVPLAWSMTPHAMFRRSFLDEHGLRFDERARRLEDHLFLSASYTAARRVSVYADSPVYIHVARSDGGGAGYAAYDPDEYYRDLAHAIGVIVAHVPPGRARDAFLSRWVRRELVGRLQSDAVRWLPHARREAFFTAVRDTMHTALPDDTLRRLPAAWRWPAALAAEASPDEFLRADDRFTTTPREDAQDVRVETLLARDVAPDALARARAHLAEDEPPPFAHMAASRRQARRRLLQLTALRVLGHAGAPVHRRLVAWGRTPVVFARQACAIIAPIAAVAASLAAVVGSPLTAAILVAVSGAMTMFLAVRSSAGWPIALRLALTLVPAAILSVGSAPRAVAVAITASLIGAAWGADHYGRRTDVRVHAGARAWSRPGRSAITTGVLAAVELVLTATSV